MTIKRKKLLSLLLVMALVFTNLSGVKVKAEETDTQNVTPTKIRKINLTVAAPEVGQPLAETVSVETVLYKTVSIETASSETVSVETASDEAAGLTCQIEKWSPEDQTAKYNTEYTVTIKLSPKDGYIIADDAIVTVNDEGVTMTDDLVSYTFSSTEKAKLIDICQPDTISVENGTSVKKIIEGLPDIVTIKTQEGESNAEVTWQTDNLESYANQKEEQQFTISGTVTIPDGFDQGEVSNKISMGIIIKAADAASAEIKGNDQLTYHGTSQDLVMGAASGGSVRYKVNKVDNDDKVVEEGEWGDTAQAEDAGKYRVSYYVEGDATHRNFGSQEEPAGTIDVIISPKDISGETMYLDGTWDERSQCYQYELNLKKITPKVTVNELEPNTDYEVSGTTSSIKYGSYSITITGKNNYCGSKDLSWCIFEKSPPEAKLELIVGDKTWDSSSSDSGVILVKGEQAIKVSAQDGENESGINQCYYYDSSERKDSSEINTDDWKPVTDNQIVIKNIGSHFLYLKAVDNAENAKIVYLNRIVLYQDAELINNEISYTRQSTSDVSIELNLNGNSIKEIKHNDTVLKSGTDYSTEDNKITLNYNFLKNLTAADSPYEFVVSYKPCGLDLDKTEGDLPTESRIMLTVSKKQGSVSIMKPIELGVYGTPLPTPEVKTNNEKAVLSYCYKKKGESDDKYISTVPKDAGEYVVKVTMEADADFCETSTVEEFIIKPKSITVSPDNKEKFVNGSEVELTYSVDGLIEGDKLENIVLEREKGENVGEYKIVAKEGENPELSNPNYSIIFKTGIYTIKATPSKPSPTTTPSTPPTATPSTSPTEEPTTPPTATPSTPPTEEPTVPPTAPPTATPSTPPTEEPTVPPTTPPTATPTAPPTAVPTATPTATPAMKITQSLVNKNETYFVPIGKNVELKITVENANKSDLEYRWYCNGKKVDGNSDKLTIKMKKTGRAVYTCDIYNKVTKETKKAAGSWKVFAYNEKVSITLNKVKKIKDIFGKGISVKDILIKEIKVPKKAKKALLVDVKKGTIKVKSYCKNAKVTLVTKSGQTISIVVTTVYPKPVVKAKKYGLKSYIEGMYRLHKLRAENVKGASKVVFEYSTQMNKGYKKTSLREVNVKKGTSYYIRIIAYYGKGKSPYSKPIIIKG